MLDLERIMLVYFQYISTIETFSTWVKNGCYKSSGKVNLSLGSFSKQIKMNSLTYSDIFVAFENFISSYTYVKTILQFS